MFPSFLYVGTHVMRCVKDLKLENDQSKKVFPDFMFRWRKLSFTSKPGCKHEMYVCAYACSLAHWILFHYSSNLSMWRTARRERHSFTSPAAPGAAVITPLCSSVIKVPLFEWYVHLSFISCLSGVRSQWQETQQGSPDIPLAGPFPAPPGGSPEIPRPYEIYNPFSMFWVWLQTPTSWMCPEGIPIRCPNHLNWILSTWRSSSCTLRFPWMSELSNLSLRLSWAALQKNVFLSYLRSHSFGHYPMLMTTGEGWDINQLVN